MINPEHPGDGALNALSMLMEQVTAMIWFGMNGQKLVSLHLSVQTASRPVLPINQIVPTLKVQHSLLAVSKRVKVWTFGHVKARVPIAGKLI